MNSVDLAALVNELRLQGNDQAELVTTHRAREGVDEGSSPHTWSFVDNADLVEWFLAQPAAGQDIREVSPEVRVVCDAIGATVREVTGWDAELFDGTVFDEPSRRWRPACRVVASGPTASVDEARDPGNYIRNRLAASGWEEDLRYAADGPGTSAYAFRSGRSVCVFSVGAPSYLSDDGKIVVAERYEVSAGCFPTTEE
jgi:hypothetical protein